MKRFRLPKDLRRFTYCAVLKRVIPFILLEVVLVLFLCAFGPELFHPLHIKVPKGFQYVCVVLVLSLPALVTGVPFKLFDRTFYGTVEQVHVKTTVDNKYGFKPTREHLYTRNTVYLTVSSPGGKRFRRKALSEKAKFQRNQDAFTKGDKVFHLYGTSLTVVLPLASSTHTPCVVCGGMTERNMDHCHQCGHSLIKEFPED